MRHIHETHTVAPDHHVQIVTASDGEGYMVTFYHGRRPEHHEHTTSLAKARRIMEDFARIIN